MVPNHKPDVICGEIESPLSNGPLVEHGGRLIDILAFGFADQNLRMVVEIIPGPRLYVMGKC